MMMPFMMRARVWLAELLQQLALMRTAIALLGLAAVASMVGTWLPQGLAIQDYVAEWGVFWGQVVWYAGLTDVFRAWWYLGLWGVLLVSVLVCVWRNRTLVYRTLALARPGWRRRLGYLLVHVGVLGVAVAGLVSGLVGWRGTLNIREGDSDSVALVWRGREAEPRFLPFKVTHEAFLIDFYDSGMPSRFATRLRFGEAAPVEVEVNRPVHHEAYTFYQASFGDGGSEVSAAGLDVATGRLAPFRAKVYDKAVLADGTRVELLDFRPFTVETLRGARPTDVGPSVDYLVQPPDAEARQLRAYLDHPDIIGVADGQGSEGVVRYRPVALGLSLKDATLWPVVAEVGRRPEAFKEILAPVLRGLADPAERVRVGLAVMQAQKVLREFGVTHLVRLDGFELRRYTGLQVVYDPGAGMFWLFSVMLGVGVLLMLAGGRRNP